MIFFEQVSKHYPAFMQSRDTLRATLRRTPSFPPFIALDNVSFHLPAGAALGVIGSNGAGKSTLLKLLSRVTRPTSGRIRVNGRLSSMLEVGAFFHHDLSGRENIFLTGAILGMSPGQIQERLDSIIAFSGLEDFLSNPVRTYSSGMLLRLAFSVGIHLDCDILVLDETLAVGDQTFREQCLTRIQVFCQNGGTLVLVSHDSHQIAEICDTGLVLEYGRPRYFGDIHTALNLSEKGT